MIIVHLLVLIGFCAGIYFGVAALTTRKKRMRMLAGLKVGDVVITVAGIKGTVTANGEKTVSLEIGGGVRVEVEKNKLESKIADGPDAPRPAFAQSSKTCPGCKAPFTPGDRFCGKCGASLPG